MAVTEAAPAVPRRITKALISSAGRPTALDSRSRPKSLIDIEGSTLVAHVLRQLYRGGIKHVVFVVSHNGPLIIQELERCVRNLKGLQLEVVDLHEDYAGFYAASLLSACERCFTDATEPGVLLATADHIFDDGLVRDMCFAPLSPGVTDVCVLVDFSRDKWAGLPATTVGVKCTKDMQRVSDLSRALGRPMVAGGLRQPQMGVEAGLFACTTQVFERLAALSKTHDYYTITDAIQELAHAGHVSSLGTKGRNWLAIETTTELEESRSSTVMKKMHSPESSPCQGLKDPLPAIFVAGGPMCT